jgi:superfamily I DNA and RNA helicase
MMRVVASYPVSGMDALAAGDLRTVFPEGLRRSSKYMTPELTADLRNWLVEPDASQTQRTPLILNRDQEQLATTRTETGYRRLKGPAGSGKSAVLAARAAELVDQGEDVLIVTFNVTLRNYLQDLAVRRSPRARRDVTWLNFHEWSRRVCFEADLITEYKRLWREYFERVKDTAPSEHIGFDATFNRELCELLSTALTGSSSSGVKRYDAILVDEAQDFRLEWWRALRLACVPAGEMLLVADATQDVYGTAGAWTENAMAGAGFRVWVL